MTPQRVDFHPYFARRLDSRYELYILRWRLLEFMPEGLMWATFNDDEEIPNDWQSPKMYQPWDDRFEEGISTYEIC